MNKLLIAVCAALFTFVFTMGPVAAQGIWGSSKDTSTTTTTEPAKTEAVKAPEGAKAPEVVKSDEVKSDEAVKPAASTDVSKPAAVGEKDVMKKDGADAPAAGCPAQQSGFGQTM